MSTITKGMVTRVTIISHVCRIIGGGYCKLMKRTMVVEQQSKSPCFAETQQKVRHSQLSKKRQILEVETISFQAAWNSR